MGSVTPLAAALIGAGGAVFGGALTVSGQLLVERARGKREQAADAARDARSLRLSVRLVMEELADASSLIENAAQSCRFWPAPRQMPTATWNEYRTEIASVIESPLDWRRITSAYDAINNLNWLVQHRRDTTTLVDDHRLGVHLEPEDETRRTWRAVRQAIESLERTIEVTGAASRLLREQTYVEREFWPHGDGDDFDLESAQEADREAQYERARREAEDY